MNRNDWADILKTPWDQEAPPNFPQGLDFSPMAKYKPTDYQSRISQILGNATKRAEYEEGILWGQIGDFPQASRQKVEKAVVAVNTARDKSMDAAREEYRKQKPLLIGPEIQAFNMLLQKAGLKISEMENQTSKKETPWWQSGKQVEERAPATTSFESARSIVEDQLKELQRIDTSGFTESQRQSWESAKSILADQFRELEHLVISEASPDREITPLTAPKKWTDYLWEKPDIGEPEEADKEKIESYARKLLTDSPEMTYEEFEKAMRKEFKDIDLSVVPIGK